MTAASCSERASPGGTGGGQGKIHYAIALHAGAGKIPRETFGPREREYLDALSCALRVGTDLLGRGGTSLDAVEEVIRVLEDDPKFNAGRGAKFTRDARHALDASIMNGRDRSSGAVTGVTTVRHPISLARRVMEGSGHVFLAGEGAERFADEVGVERVEPEFFFTQKRFDALRRAQERDQGDGNPAPGGNTDEGTVGVAAMDCDGNLAAGTSTGGLTNMRFGRVGDSPIIGAGTFADNRTCAVSGTGKGEQLIRHHVTSDIAALMEYRGLSLQQAAEEVVLRKLDPGDGGIIGVARDGSVAMVFNTAGMFRGAADSSGRFKVAIWK